MPTYPTQPTTQPKTNPYQKNPTVDAMSTGDQLNYYKNNQAEAGNEILRAKQVYDLYKDSDPNRAAAAHTWADQLRSATGIQDSNPVYGNNNGVDPAAQSTMTNSILNGGNQNQVAPQAQPSAGGNYNSANYMQNAQNMIDSIYNNNYASQLQKLRDARDTALQGLNAQQTQATQSAYDQRNNADTASLQNAQRLKEMMANNGLGSSGDNIQANVDLGTARQAAMNTINRNEGNTLQNLSQQRSQIMNNAANNDLALMQQLQAARGNQLLDATNTDAARQLQIAQLMGNFNGQNTMAMQNQQFNQNLDTQKFSEAQKQDNIGNAMQLSQIMGQLYQPKSGGEELFNQTPLGNTLSGNQFVQNTAMQNADLGLKQQQLQQSAQQFAAQMGLDYNKLSLQQQQMLMDQAYRNGTLGLEQDKLDWTKDPTNPQNQYLQSEINWRNAQANYYGNKSNLPMSQDDQKIANLIDSSPYIQKPRFDPTTGEQIGGGVSDPQGLARYIASLGLPADQAKQWFMRYGLWNGDSGK